MKRHFQSGDPPKVIGHRGAGGSHPENTLASFEAAIAAGAHFVEMDVRCTRDGVAVLFHDDVLVRTVRRSGRVDDEDAGRRFGDLTWAEAGTLDVGSWRHVRFAGERPPSLAQAAEVCRGRAVLVLDLKQDGIGEAIARGLREARLSDEDVVLGPWDEGQARDLRAALPGHPMTLIGEPVVDCDGAAEWLNEAARLGVDGLHLDWRKLDPAIVREAIERGFAVTSWTINEEAEMIEAIDMGLNAICTDHPAVCTRLIAAHCE